MSNYRVYKHNRFDMFFIEFFDQIDIFGYKGTMLTLMLELVNTPIETIPDKVKNQFDINNGYTKNTPFFFYGSDLPNPRHITDITEVFIPKEQALPRS